MHDGTWVPGFLQATHRSMGHGRGSSATASAPVPCTSGGSRRSGSGAVARQGKAILGAFHPDVGRFLTAPQVAEELATSEVQVIAMLRRGEICALQLGGRRHERGRRRTRGRISSGAGGPAHHLARFRRIACRATSRAPALVAVGVGRPDRRSGPRLPAAAARQPVRVPAWAGARPDRLSQDRRGHCRSRLPARLRRLRVGQSATALDALQFSRHWVHRCAAGHRSGSRSLREPPVSSPLILVAGRLRVRAVRVGRSEGTPLRVTDRQRPRRPGEWRALSARPSLRARSRGGHALRASADRCGLRLPLHMSGRISSCSFGAFHYRPRPDRHVLALARHEVRGEIAGEVPTTFASRCRPPHGLLGRDDRELR